MMKKIHFSCVLDFVSKKKIHLSTVESSFRMMGLRWDMCYVFDHY